MEKEVQCNNRRKGCEKKIPSMISTKNISYEMQKRKKKQKPNF
jgi:hypothetical protein